MAAAHSLPDSSKAVRCCVNCAALGAVKIGSDFGVQKGELIERSFVLAEEQIIWAKGKVGSDDKNAMSTLVADIVKASMAADEQTVFGVVRCKLKVAECEGAKDAVDQIEKKYGAVQVKEDIWQGK
eukprot:CAMPEP_0113527782 /NCGR_PEP_ID=MMETSP0015_2-20120614/1482_1 /TAXON_ID=2838 /ORGANISM="Odontella" /LENGTH=125 /DNA_ID=CAMNT_0000426245 /DNA_START=159 /DNA_END=536 /DNA_ORIENTATION=+ /assembly_acc=CAM_ASM_000160